MQQIMAVKKELARLKIEELIRKEEQLKEQLAILREKEESRMMRRV